MTSDRGIVGWWMVLSCEIWVKVAGKFVAANPDHPGCSRPRSLRSRALITRLGHYEIAAVLGVVAWARSISQKTRSSIVTALPIAPPAQIRSDLIDEVRAFLTEMQRDPTRLVSDGARSMLAMIAKHGSQR